MSEGIPVEQLMRYGPPAPIASREMIREVEDMLTETGGDVTKIADWVARKVEHVGGTRARPFFDDEGNGPGCSWCGAIWPLCGHAVMSEVLGEQSDARGWWTR